MNIKFEKLERVDGQKADGSTWVAYKIVGNRLDGKGQWSSGNIFDNKYNSKLLEDVNALEEGDKVKVSHEKNAQGFWKITGVSDMTEEEIKEAENPTRKGTGNSGSTGGTGRSTTWNGRTGEAYDRSAAIYLAFDMLKESAHDVAALEPEEVLAKSLTIAEMINDYIHDGDVVAVIPDENDDGLTPPSV